MPGSGGVDGRLEVTEKRQTIRRQKIREIKQCRRCFNGYIETGNIVEYFGGAVGREVKPCDCRQSNLCMTLDTA